eukprot:TRINITY_DN328_c0_g1_i4.p1 TRINITY_DN328_c0_g1~~TRINITY_DN328_c0_g1_i4.p1  ORF type:complete len:201 (+),score=-12.52 TRINITY_DN328_c0_g1_i4:303-905(+)
MNMIIQFINIYILCNNGITLHRLGHESSDTSDQEKNNGLKKQLKCKFQTGIYPKKFKYINLQRAQSFFHIKNKILNKVMLIFRPLQQGLENLCDSYMREKIFQNKNITFLKTTIHTINNLNEIKKICCRYIYLPVYTVPQKITKLISIYIGVLSKKFNQKIKTTQQSKKNQKDLFIYLPVHTVTQKITRLISIYIGVLSK